MGSKKRRPKNHDPLAEPVEPEAIDTDGDDDELPVVEMTAEQARASEPTIELSPAQALLNAVATLPDPGAIYRESPLTPDQAQTIVDAGLQGAETGGPYGAIVAMAEAVAEIATPEQLAAAERLAKQERIGAWLASNAHKRPDQVALEKWETPTITDLKINDTGAGNGPGPDGGVADCSAS